MDFKPGDVVYHKATHKRCVVKEPGEEGTVLVTTQDDEIKNYQPEELWTEEEWKARNRNLAASFSKPNIDPYW